MNTGQNHVFIIAEAGVNHNGDYNTALKMIDAAKAAGADAIKFQTFRSEKLVSRNAQKAEYQKRNTHNDDSQLDMLKKLELSFREFSMLKDYCDEQGILFLSTPFDFDSIDFLNQMELPLFKIPSGEITNLPYLMAIARTRRDIILSTGMADIPEIDAALQVLQKYGAGQISLLHCTTEYPAPMREVNLNAIQTLKHQFGLPVGYSDHTAGIEVSIAAAAVGAVILEKHFTLDKTMDGPDHKASLEPAELSALVHAVRNIEAAMGAGSKKPTPSEIKNKEIARKSIVAARDIQKGELFTEDNLTVKRPGNGISPMKWFDVIGTAAPRAFREDELIEL